MMNFHFGYTFVAFVASSVEMYNFYDMFNVYTLHTIIPMKSETFHMMVCCSRRNIGIELHKTVFINIVQA